MERYKTDKIAQINYNIDTNYFENSDTECSSTSIFFNVFDDSSYDELNCDNWKRWNEFLNSKTIEMK